MTALGIRKTGDKVLKEKAAPVVKFDRKLKRLLNDMAQTMYDADGVGLAAPQVGVSLRIIVVDAGDGLVELVNPVITQAEGSDLAIEGCLSVPGIVGEVDRCAKVTVEGLNRDGKKVCITTDGLQARAFQHEIDHLEGILFIDKAQTLYKRQSND